MSLSNFQMVAKLGEGAYSSVYKVRRLTDNCEYALKKVRMLNLSEKEKENALNEVRILASIKSPNIIQYKEAFIDESSQSLWFCLYLPNLHSIVMEFADNGDLFQKICEHQKNNTHFPEEDIWRILIQVVRGLRALHELNIMHRDLKSANVFLFKDLTAKLGDLNVSKVAKKGLGYTQTGTPYYASPEVWRDQPYDTKSDVWSLGCVLYESITLKPPFRAQDMASLYKKVLKEQILRLPAITHRINKMFPNENFDSTEQNALMSTIRIPKNIMYLSDKLPRPTYDPLSPTEKDLRSTANAEGYSLPAIRGPKQKDVQRHYKVAAKRKYKKPPPPEMPESNPALPEPKEVVREDLHKPKMNGRHLASIVEESPKQVIESPTRNNKDPGVEGGDSYIQHILSKKNPLMVKPQKNENMRRIANIYSGHNADYIISMHKRKIDRILEMNRKDRGLGKGKVKGYPYNLVPYLDPSPKMVRPKVPLIPEIIGQHKIRYPLKAVARVLPYSNIGPLPEHSLKGIVGSRYMHQPSGSLPHNHY